MEVVVQPNSTSDTQVQFNDGGTNFGGDAGLVYNKTTDTLTAVNINATSITTTNITSSITTSSVVQATWFNYIW